MKCNQVYKLTFSLCLLTLLLFAHNNSANASCGSASCFLNIGNQPSVQPKGLVRADVNYSYVPQKGPSKRVASVDLENRSQILSEHQEFQTINQQLQLNLNYGLTDNFTLQLTVPVLFREHDHQIETGIEPDAGPGVTAGSGNFENFDTTGLGDIQLMGKYGFLPTLRSLVVVGAGVQFPTGNFQTRNIEGGIQEPTLQVGRGDYGAIGQIYQSFELIPHALNQFFSYTYRHTFENKFHYQFGDTHIVNLGMAYHATPKVVLSGQVNFQYRGHDTYKSSLSQAGPIGMANPPTVIDSNLRNRRVRNTGSSNLMFSPGLTLNLSDTTSWYFFSQVPLWQDFNGGLEQGVSFLTGFVRYFNVGGEA